MIPCAFQAAQHGFELPLSYTLLAYLTSGISGALAGMRRGYDIIGVLFLALITAGGGSLIRDGLLLSTGPATLMTDSRFILVVVLGALVAVVFHRFLRSFNRAIAVVDALGLGAFAVVGVERTLAAGLGIPAAFLGGMLTAVGGGLLRDVLVREEPLLFKPGQFYGLVALVGCGLFMAMLRWNWVAPYNAAISTIVIVFVLRMLAIRFNWRTTALRPEDDPTG